MTDRPARARFAEELGFVADLTIEGWLDDVLNEHAHHLAEQQRTDANLRETEGETGLAAYGRELADLIDPEARR